MYRFSPFTDCLGCEPSDPALRVLGRLCLILSYGKPKRTREQSRYFSRVDGEASEDRAVDRCVDPYAIISFIGLADSIVPKINEYLAIKAGRSRSQGASVLTASHETILSPMEVPHLQEWRLIAADTF